jgi:hypothetical protein
VAKRLRSLAEVAVAAAVLPQVEVRDQALAEALAAVEVEAAAGEAAAAVVVSAAALLPAAAEQQPWLLGAGLQQQQRRPARARRAPARRDPMLPLV